VSYLRTTAYVFVKPVAGGGLERFDRYRCAERDGEGDGCPPGDRPQRAARPTESRSAFGMACRHRAAHPASV